MNSISRCRLIKIISDYCVHCPAAEPIEGTWADRWFWWKGVKRKAQTSQQREGRMDRVNGNCGNRVSADWTNKKWSLLGRLTTNHPSTWENWQHSASVSHIVVTWSGWLNEDTEKSWAVRWWSEKEKIRWTTNRFVRFVCDLWTIELISPHVK